MRDSAVTRVLGRTLLVVLLFAAVLPPLDRVFNGLAMLRGGDAVQRYDREEFGDYGRGAETLTEVARHVRERTRPGDTVLMWGMSGAVNFLSDRPSPSRFGVNLPLTEGGDHPLRREYREEFMSAMSAAPPAFVVIHIPECDTVDGGDPLRSVPEFARFLARRYAVERTVGCSQIFRLVTPRTVL